jgi:hypothetical protein
MWPPFAGADNVWLLLRSGETRLLDPQASGPADAEIMRAG